MVACVAAVECWGGETESPFGAEWRGEKRRRVAERRGKNQTGGGSVCVYQARRRKRTRYFAAQNLYLYRFYEKISRTHTLTHK